MASINFLQMGPQEIQDVDEIKEYNLTNQCEKVTCNIYMTI